MVEPQEQLKVTLKKSGQSLTMPRQVVFKALQGKEPQTMAEIVKNCPSIDRASVYRTIALFETLDIAHRLQIGWKYKLELSDSFHKHHHHMTCIVCGQTTALPEDLRLETQLRLLADRHRLKMRDHQLEIQGLCETCYKT